MKRLKYKILLPAALVAISVVIACNKFLDKAPVGTAPQSGLYNKSGVEGLLIGAYSLLDGEGGNNSGWGSAASNWVYGSVCADESYKGSTPSDQGDIFPLEIWTATATNPYPAMKWATCYDGVQRANEVIRALAQTTDISTEDATQLTAEARFLRGHYHFELKKVFGNVPFIGESVVVTTTPAETPNIDGSGNYVNIWPQINADFKFAVDNLPETQDQIGRANKWAAMAFLAKAYMFQKNYDSAKYYLDQIIASGKTTAGIKYALTVDYFDNFNAATQNNSETVFAAQMSVNDGSGTAQNNDLGIANGNYGDVLNFPYNNGPGGCCGFNNPSQTLANAYKTDANGLPLLTTYNTGSAVSAHTSPYTGTLDPRIDMVMGRPGIPFLDWGVIPADDSWIRHDQGSNGRFVPKKNDYYKSQQGSLSSTENFWAAIQLTANNVNLIRYADVLLWAAECEVRVANGDVNKALDYVNQVRNRVANSSTWVKNAAGTGPADNYSIKPYPAGAFNDKTYAMQAIMFERRLELALEGHRFFDLVRWGTAVSELNAYATYEHQIKNCYVFNEVRTFTAKSELYPIPQGQIDALNAGGTVALKQNPGY